MRPKLIVFGIGDFPQMVAHHFEREAGFQIAGFTAHERFVKSPRLGDLPLAPFESLSEMFSPKEHQIFVALESGRQNLARAEVLEEALAMGYSPASFISPSAEISSGAKIGKHCLVLEQAIVQYGAEIGANNIILAKSFFGQNCRVGANNYFASDFFADRHSRIGSYCVFGSRVAVAESVAVTDWTSIQAFERIRESITVPTIIHPALRTPGRIVDRRS